MIQRPAKLCRYTSPEQAKQAVNYVIRKGTNKKEAFTLFNYLQSKDKIIT